VVSVQAYGSALQIRTAIHSNNHSADSGTRHSRHLTEKGLGAEGVEDQFGVDHPLACWDEDVLQRTCQEIIRLSSKVMAEKNFSKGFVFDNGIISCVFDVVLLCPEQDLRKEALEILRQLVPRREGIWCSVTLLKKAEEILIH